jgi:glycosyltransferase involved in cell wall biosynthesis
MEGEKLKILMTADTIGGVWTYAIDLCAALEKYPVEIHLVTFGSYLTKHQQDKVKELGNVVIYESGYKLEWMDEPWDEIEKACLWVKDIFDDINPDLIHFNNYGQAHKDWKVPTIVVAHSCVLSWWRAVKNEEAPPEWERYRNVVSQALMKADIVVSPTWSFLAELENIYGSFIHKKVIQNGRKYPKFTHGKKENIVLSAGRVWDEAKNISSLIKMSGFLDWPVFIAGEKNHPVTNKIIRTENIHYLGHLSDNELYEWMQKASIYALPAHYEPFGLSILEAAHAGCALVLGNIGTLRELWDGSALFVDNNKPDEVAAALDKLIHDDILRTKYASKAKERSYQYGLENMGQQYYRTYCDLLPEFSGKRKTTIVLKK